MSKTLGQRLEDLNIEVGTAITIDWNQVRIHAAIAAMQAELTNPNNVFSMCEDKQATIVRRAVRYADALIAELQKKGEQQ